VGRLASLTVRMVDRTVGEFVRDDTVTTDGLSVGPSCMSTDRPPAYW